MKYKTKNGFEFEHMPMEWAKRRIERNKEPDINNIELLNFELKENHKCLIVLEYKNQEKIKLDAKVSMCCTYVKKDGKLTKNNIRWTVQGIDYKGNNVQLRILT